MKHISLGLAVLLLVSLLGCGAKPPESPEAAVDRFFAGNYAYRSTQETLDENGNIVQTVIEGKRTNDSPAKEAYRYVECPYPLSWTECYAEETQNGVTKLKLYMNTGKWVLTSGYLGTPSYHENLRFDREEVLNGEDCLVYTTSYEWSPPESYGLTEEETAALTNGTISLTYYLSKETGLPVRIVTDNGPAMRWANIAYTYANRTASLLPTMTLQEAMDLYPADEAYHSVQIFDVLDFGKHISITDPSV